MSKKSRSLKIGIVCPYSFDAPGGVQVHIRDLAEVFIQQGHQVDVLAPADEDLELPQYMTSAGGSVPLRYNGSVARLSFGPVTATRVRRWLAGGDFDIIHIHEPVTPSIGMLALWQHQGPIVATFHTSLVRSRALQIAYPMVRPILEKVAGRIAVSEDARRTLIEHLGGDAVVIPNGVELQTFREASPDPRWTGTDQAPTIAFLGRLDEPRKGLSVLTGAVPTILERYPQARFLVAGGGDDGRDQMISELGPLAKQVEFLGRISDEDKAALLSSVDLYVAPQTGGESFGIVLVEAMSAGTCVVSSDLGAFRRVLDEGKAGALFKLGDSADLAATILRLLGDRAERTQLVEYAKTWVDQYDWSVVSKGIMAVYRTVLESYDLHRELTEAGGNKGTGVK